MARARTLMGTDYDVIALIGDGALTGGLAYEGLSDAGQSGEPMVIVLNDNGMSINKNVGGMATLLSKQRVKPGYLHFKRFYRSTVGKGARTVSGTASHEGARERPRPAEQYVRRHGLLLHRTCRRAR